MLELYKKSEDAIPELALATAEWILIKRCGKSLDWAGQLMGLPVEARGVALAGGAPRHE